MTSDLKNEVRQTAGDRITKKKKDQPGNGRYGRERWYQWLKWGDFLIYTLIGGLAVVLMLALPRFSAQSGTSALLTMDNQVLLQLSGDELAATGETDLTANGYHYKLSWQNGAVRFSAADCPDKICVRTGWISHTSEIAACVPGHLILKITGQPATNTSDTSEVDVIIK